MGIPVDNEEKLSLVHVWPGNGRLPTISKPILVLKQKTDVEIESGYLPTIALTLSSSSLDSTKQYEYAMDKIII